MLDSTEQKLRVVNIISCKLIVKFITRLITTSCQQNEVHLIKNHTTSLQHYDITQEYGGIADYATLKMPVMMTMMMMN